MARPPTGQVLERRGKSGTTFALRFRAYGTRHYITTAATSRKEAEEELANVLADVRRGIWRAPAVEPVTQPREEPDFWTFHSADWWRRLWYRSGTVDVDRADFWADGWRDWALWNEVCAEVGDNEFVVENAGREARMLRLDAGRNLGFARVIARRR